MGGMKRAVSEVHEGLRETAKEIGLNIRDEKQKQWVQNKRKRRIRKIFTIKDHDIEVVRKFKYLWTVISNTNCEMIIKAIILAANKA
jgi:hypothetical protein